MALALTLKPQERVILGKAVVRNASRQSIRLVVETEIPVLRQTDILPEGQARTPCARLYLTVQMLYLEPEQQEAIQELYLRLAREVVAAAPSLSPLLQEISLHVAAGAYYRALQTAKVLRKQEERLMLGARQGAKSMA
jgi:flagellar biosynthesis repressor protein FlbT